MPRVKGGKINKNRRKKVLKQTKGYFGSKGTLYKTAKEQLMRSLAYSYRDRKQRKRQFRKLWNTRINAAARLNGLNYSRLINGLKVAGIEVNRKMLAAVAIDDSKAFTDLCAIAKDALAGKSYSGGKATGESAKAEVKVEKAPKKEEPAKAEKAAVEENVAASQDDISSMPVAELKELAKTKGIKVTGLKKAELIEAIQNA